MQADNQSFRNREAFRSTGRTRTEASRHCLESPLPVAILALFALSAGTHTTVSVTPREYPHALGQSADGFPRRNRRRARILPAPQVDTSVHARHRR